MPLTWYGRNLRADTWIANASMPSVMYLALCDSAPSLDVTGTTLQDIEPYYAASYARLAVDMDTGSWDVSVNGIVTNSDQLEFATPTEAWGSVSHYALCDAVTEGNVLIYGALSVTVNPVIGQKLVIASGQLRIREL